MAEATGVADTPDAEARRLLLRAADIACPRCRYNLRGVTSSACPECGEPLALTLVRTGPTRQSRRLMLLVCAWILALNMVAAWTQYNFVARYYRATLDQAEQSVQSAQQRVDGLESNHQRTRSAEETSSVPEMDAMLIEARMQLSQRQVDRDSLPKTLLGYFLFWPGLRWMSLLAALGTLAALIGLIMIGTARTTRRLIAAALLGMVFPAVTFTILLIYYARMVWQM